MTLLLTKLATLFLNLGAVGGLFYNSDDWRESTNNFSWLGPIAKFLDDALVPIIIIVGTLGAIWVIILGVNLARAESSDKAQEAKKRLINVIIAILAVVVLVFILAFFLSNVPKLFGASASNPIKNS